MAPSAAGCLVGGAASAAREHGQRWRVKHRARRAAAVAAHATAAVGFHALRMAATEDAMGKVQPIADMAIHAAEADVELEASAWLRAMSFYAYPPERKFAGEVRRGAACQERLVLLPVAAGCCSVILLSACGGPVRGGWPAV